MAFFYWFFAILMGVSVGVGLSFLIFSAILNKSNNKGDSRLKNEDFSSQVVYLSQENNMGRNEMLFTNYVETNIEVLSQSRDYQHRCASAIKAPADALVERYIPVEEDAGAGAVAGAGVDVVAGVVAGAADGVAGAGVAGVAGADGVGVDGMGSDGAGAVAKKTYRLGEVGISSSANNESNLIRARYNIGGMRSLSFGEKMAVLNGSAGVSVNNTSTPKESSWASARRRSMGSDASENPWGRDENWGQNPDTVQKMDEPTMDLGMKKEKPKMTQEEIDAFWSGGRKTQATAAADTAAADTSAATPVGGASAATGTASPFAASAFGEDTSMPDPTLSASPMASAPAPQEPIYDAPTATKPLWENTSSNDDFSDFEDFM